MKKKLRPLLAAALASSLFINNAKAQTTPTTPVNPWHFGVGFESGITTSGISSKTEIGATARLQYDISKHFALTLTSGYYEFLNSTTRNSMGLVPVKLGLKAFVGSGFYFSGEVGAGIETQSYNALKDANYGLPKTTKLILSPGFGYAIKSFDFSLRYETFTGNNKVSYDNTDFALIGLRVGYSF